MPGELVIFGGSNKANSTENEPSNYGNNSGNLPCHPRKQGSPLMGLQVLQQALEVGVCFHCEDCGFRLSQLQTLKDHTSAKHVARTC